jgi:hypothetical protein
MNRPESRAVALSAPRLTINENAPFMHELLGATPTVSEYMLLHLIVC